ncbi:MAG: type II CRISPR-associated endonuclease Cas1 [Mycoplasmataceae bacterium]|nr:type II CRISPR-associated endonuclease Cas1 [Mycoplasmataceae bacterium]
MGWRTIVIRKSSKISYKLGYVIIRNEEETFIVADEISVLFLESNQCMITTELLNQLIKRNVSVIFCDETHLPNSQLIGLHGNYKSSKNLHMQIEWLQNTKDKLWKEIIKQKIINQSKILEKYNFTLQAEMLLRYCCEVQDNDISNREGHAASVYFTSIFGKSFNRRDNENEINKVLNYLYSILLSCFSRVVIEYGYSNQLGIWHKNEFNFYNLSCDLMEPFRFIIDDYVLTNKFKINQKNELQKILLCKIFINKKTETFENAIKIFTKNCINSLNDNKISIPNIESYEF